MPEESKSLRDLASTLSLVFLSLILSAFVLTKLASLGQFNRLDSVPAFGQIYTGVLIAITPVILSILHPVSHFREVLVSARFGSAVAP